MGTTISPEISQKSKYWIDRHRYYELKHFCLQYPLWKRSYLVLDGLSKRSMEINNNCTSNKKGDPTAKCAIAKNFYKERMDMIERIAENTDPELASYILKAVTEGVSFSNLKARLEIPCGKDTYYDRYRQFFWLLSKERG